MNQYRGFDHFKNLIIRDKYSGNAALFSEADVQRLKKGEPVDYIIGWAPFLNTAIDLSKRPLIPRPETEYWVKQAIEEIESARGKDTKFYALDIFAGSGCIGIAMLKHFAHAVADFADVDPVMGEQIKINLKKNAVEARARIIHSDGFKKIKKRYDFIFANPPYVSAREMEKLPKSVKNFEPREALFGGKNGLEIIDKFLSEAKKYLKKDGALYMEFGTRQKKSIAQYIKKEWRSIEFFKDQYGRWRVFKGC